MAEKQARLFRLFVACELSDDVRRALGNVQDDLRRAIPVRLRWVRPEGIHITLKFLGEVEAARVGEIESALGAAIDPFEARVRPAGLGGFPSASLRASGGSRLRVVWVGLAGDVECLARLAERVDGALAPLGFPSEARPFAAHLTLARVPDEASPEDRRRLAGLLEGHSLAELPSMILTEAHLIRSVLEPGGSAYQRLATFPSTDA